MPEESVLPLPLFFCFALLQELARSLERVKCLGIPTWT